jgi:hypothetical protein
MMAGLEAVERADMKSVAGKKAGIWLAVNHI